MTARFIGDDRMIENLNRIVRQFETRATAQPGAERLRDEMQARVARDTDQLHDSIDVRHHEDGLTVGPDDDGFYGYFLEKGTSKMAPRPWFRPAVDAGRKPAVRAIRGELRQAIDRIWGR